MIAIRFSQRTSEAFAIAFVSIILPPPVRPSKDEGGRDCSTWRRAGRAADASRTHDPVFPFVAGKATRTATRHAEERHDPAARAGEFAACGRLEPVLLPVSPDPLTFRARADDPARTITHRLAALVFGDEPRGIENREPAIEQGGVGSGHVSPSAKMTAAVEAPVRREHVVAALLSINRDEREKPARPFVPNDQLRNGSVARRGVRFAIDRRCTTRFRDLGSLDRWPRGERRARAHRTAQREAADEPLRRASSCHARRSDD
jgi:hypothetical protein